MRGTRGGEESLVAFDLDRERILTSEQGRRGWMREGRHQLDELRRQQARPIAASRTERLLRSQSAGSRKSIGSSLRRTRPMRHTRRAG